MNVVTSVSPMYVNTPQFSTKKRIWLVGEHNPYRAETRYALFPWPRVATGARLMRALELTDREYLAKFERRNLLQELPWSAPKARDAARAVVAEAHAGGAEGLVLLGAKVTVAFGLSFTPFSVAHTLFSDDDRRLWTAILPHPSGLSRGWNAPGARDLAKACVSELEGLL